MPKLSMKNNPVARRKRRYRMLQKRAHIVFQYMRPATVEYGKDGYAARLYPNLHPKQHKARQLHRHIKKEMDSIAKWLHKYGYTLA